MERRALRLRRMALPGRRVPPSNAAGSHSRAVLRRRVERGRRCRGASRRRVSAVGRAARRWCESASNECGRRLRPSGRNVRFGIRLHVITRDTEGEAWNEADRLLDTMDPALVIGCATAALGRASRSANSACSPSTGADRNELEVSPNLWAGIGLVRPGAGTALVGSHEQVAERIARISRARARRVHPFRHPHLEEAYAVGENVLPLLGATSRRPDARNGLRRPGTIPIVTRIGRSVCSREAATDVRSTMSPPYLAVALDGAGWHPAAWRESDARRREDLRAPVLGRAWSKKPNGPVSISSPFEDSLLLQSTSAKHPRRAHGPSARPARRSARLRRESPQTTARSASSLWRLPPTPSHSIFPRPSPPWTTSANGRAGFQARISPTGLEAAQFGRAPPSSRTRPTVESSRSVRRYDLMDEAADFVEVVAPPVGQLGGRRRDP